MEPLEAYGGRGVRRSTSILVTVTRVTVGNLWE